MKPLDFSKFRKEITKKLDIIEGFHDPKTWLDTGNFVLNYRISGDFFKGIPLDGKVSVFAGESGSGKSYFVSGNLIKYAINNGISVILLDSEDAVDRSWISALGVDPDDPNLMRLPVSSPDDCGTTINTLMSQYVAEYKNVDEEDRPKILFVIDSLGMLTTSTERDQFEKGDMKGDMGRKAKQLKALVTQCIRLFNGWPIGMVATNHTYKSQDTFNPDDIVSGGSGFIYASSIIVSMNKLKLKEDEDGNKTKEINGIRSKVKVVKTRFSKPFEEVVIQIPYDTGMNPYSGLVEMCEKAGILVKEGNRMKYVSLDGTEHKMYRKEWNKDTDRLNLLMSEFEAQMEKQNAIASENDDDDDE